MKYLKNLRQCLLTSCVVGPGGILVWHGMAKASFPENRSWTNLSSWFGQASLPLLASGGLSTATFFATTALKVKLGIAAGAIATPVFLLTIGPLSLAMKKCQQRRTEQSATIPSKSNPSSTESARITTPLLNHQQVS